MIANLLSLFTAVSVAGAFPVLVPKTEDCRIQRVDFLEPVQTLTELNLPLTAMQGSPLIELLDEQGRLQARCSSNVVSDQGTLLTAGHCVEACLKNAGVFERSGSITKVNKEKLSAITCNIRVNGQPTAAEVLATNDCRGPGDWKNGAPAECGADFAVLRLSDPGVLKNAGCFHVSDRNPAAGARVATIGHPVATRRDVLKTAAKDSNGKDQFVSYGQTIKFSPTCSTEMDSDRSVPYETEMSKLPVGLYSTRVNSGASIQTTVDITSGNSGGGLIDIATGELLGTASSNVFENRLRECKGASFFSSTREMSEIIKRDYPNLNLKRTFSCDKNALVKTSRI